MRKKHPRVDRRARPNNDENILSGVVEARAEAIARTVAIPYIPQEVQAAAMALSDNEVAAYLESNGYPASAQFASMIDIRLERRGCAGWLLTMSRSLHAGVFEWHLTATCSHVPNDVDMAFLERVKTVMKVPANHPLSPPSEKWPPELRCQQFNWIWEEPPAN